MMLCVRPIELHIHINIHTHFAAYSLTSIFLLPPIIIILCHLIWSALILCKCQEICNVLMWKTKAEAAAAAAAAVNAVKNMHRSENYWSDNYYYIAALHIYLQRAWLSRLSQCEHVVKQKQKRYFCWVSCGFTLLWISLLCCHRMNA